ncbi:hypothetical protein ACPCF3_13465 [Enterococcus mundtii]
MKKHIYEKYNNEKKAEEKSTVNIKMQNIIDKAVEKSMASSSKRNENYSQEKSKQEYRK